MGEVMSLALKRSVLLRKRMTEELANHLAIDRTYHQDLYHQQAARGKLTSSWRWTRTIQRPRSYGSHQSPRTEFDRTRKWPPRSCTFLKSVRSLHNDLCRYKETHIKTLTFSKQCIHFFLSLRCPPTSNILYKSYFRPRISLENLPGKEGKR